MNIFRVTRLHSLLLSGLLLATPFGSARAQCSAQVTIDGPDANGDLRVTGQTPGTCGGASVTLKIDGAQYGDAVNCADGTQPCRPTWTFNVPCGWNGFTHTFQVLTTCGQITGTDQQGNPICTGGTGTASQSATFAPTPTISVTHSDPDTQGNI